MNTTVSPSLPREVVLPLRIITVLISGLALFIFAVVATIIGFGVAYSGYIYPGVSVGWADVSGLTSEEAAAQLAKQFDYPRTGRILLRDEDNVWIITPGEAGLFLGPEHNAILAYNVGREGDLVERLTTQIQAWRSGIILTPEYIFDERTAQETLGEIAAQINRPTVEATISVSGVDVVAIPGQVGRKVNIDSTLGLLLAQVQTLKDGEIPLVVEETPPGILDASEQAEVARQILSAPLKLKVPGVKEGGPGPWVFQPEDVAAKLTIERVSTPEGERYQVGLNSEELRGFLEGIAPNLLVQPENARFIFNDNTRQLDLIQPAVIGQALDIETSIQAINQKLLNGEHTIPLDMAYTQPDVTDDATAESLGISELVSVHTSYFYGSSTSRIHNIQTASARFHGVFIPPGATFSMGEALGDVSLDTGYSEALIIYGDRTIKGVGGGVCQVSTTLFRTIFFGGYPVVERHPHAYRVYYYEQTPSGGIDTRLAGLDATVYVPIVDLKFTNDTHYWLLMETYVNPGARTLTWKFYSTSDGRSVEWQTTGPTNRVDPPEPLYQENPELTKGDIKQVDWPAEGADVTVNRTVYRDGRVIIDDIFATHYLPWRAVCEYGPGTIGMPPKNPDPNNPCKPDTGKKKQ